MWSLFGMRTASLSSRTQLKLVKRLGDQAFIQAAGFLKIADGEEPLDSTSVHPESYEVARRLLKELTFEPKDILNKDVLNLIKERLKLVDVDKTAAKLEVGKPTLKDIIEALAKPWRDPREDLPNRSFGMMS